MKGKKGKTRPKKEKEKVEKENKSSIVESFFKDLSKKKKMNYNQNFKMVATGLFSDYYSESENKDPSSYSYSYYTDYSSTQTENEENHSTNEIISTLEEVTQKNNKKEEETESDYIPSFLTDVESDIIDREEREPIKQTKTKEKETLQSINEQKNKENNSSKNKKSNKSTNKNKSTVKQQQQPEGFDSPKESFLTLKTMQSNETVFESKNTKENKANSKGKNPKNQPKENITKNETSKELNDIKKTQQISKNEENPKETNNKEKENTKEANNSHKDESDDYYSYSYDYEYVKSSQMNSEDEIIDKDDVKYKAHLDLITDETNDTNVITEIGEKSNVNLIDTRDQIEYI